ALAAEIVGEHAAEQPAETPAEYRDGDDRAGIGGNELVLRGGKQLMQRHTHGEDEREHLEAVEGPAEVRGDERLPLRASERAMTRHGAARGNFGRVSPPVFLRGSLAGGLGDKKLNEIGGAGRGWPFPATSPFGRDRPD